jgi:protein TonB
VYASPRERAASALAAFCIVLLLVLALIFGLRVVVAARAGQSFVSVLLDRPKPPEPKPSPKHGRRTQNKAAKGAPAPRGLKNRATPIVAPPVVPLIPPPPVVVATQAGTGSAVSNGASDRPGPGQGAGGIGNGLGGGGDGGNGAGGGVAVGPRQIHGRLSFSDMPDGLLAPGAEARVGIRYVVDVDGSVIQCRVDQPSGYPLLDGLTCRLVSQRFRFKPARDFTGRPVRAAIAEAHTWFTRERGDRD